MNTELATQIFDQLIQYVNHLDWTYILTFIMIAYGVNHRRVTSKLKKATRVTSKTRYRTALVGLIYGVAIYFLRSYEINQIEMLFQSFIFTMVFHQLIIDTVVKFIGKTGLANSSLQQ